MVDVVDGRARENKKKERLERLVNLASGIFGEKQVTKPFFPATDFYVQKERLAIYPDLYEIKLLNKEDYDNAFKLAEAYEKIDNNKTWTIRTFY